MIDPDTWHRVVNAAIRGEPDIFSIPLNAAATGLTEDAIRVAYDKLFEMPDTRLEMACPVCELVGFDCGYHEPIDVRR